MRKRITSALIAFLLLALPLAALAETMYVTTPNGGSVHMRSGPSTDDEILISVGYGEPVELIDFLAGSSWANVNYNGYFGYIALRYLTDYPPIPNPTFWPTFVPAPTARPTGRPAPSPTKQPSGDTLERELAKVFKGFNPASYDAVVVPSTPSTYVNLRWAPSKSAPVRAQYWAGNVLQVLSQNDTWSEVYDAQAGRYGFIMTHFLTPAVFGSGADS